MTGAFVWRALNGSARVLDTSLETEMTRCIQADGRSQSIARLANASPGQDIVILLFINGTDAHLSCGVNFMFEHEIKQGSIFHV